MMVSRIQLSTSLPNSLLWRDPSYDQIYGNVCCVEPLCQSGVQHRSACTQAAQMASFLPRLPTGRQQHAAKFPHSLATGQRGSKEFGRECLASWGVRRTCTVWRLGSVGLGGQGKCRGGFSSPEAGHFKKGWKKGLIPTFEVDACVALSICHCNRTLRSTDPISC